MPKRKQNLYDQELERSALSAIALTPGFLVKAQDFLGSIEVFTTTRQTIYEKMLSFKSTWDGALLRARLSKEARSEFVAIQISPATPIPWHLLKTYLGDLKILAVKRGQKDLLEGVNQEFEQGKDPVITGHKYIEALTGLEGKVEQVKFGMTALESLAAPNKESPSPVKGGIAEPGRYTIAGATDGEGKTTLMLQFALCAATGTTFLGLFPIPKPVKVLYCCGENVKPDMDEKLTYQIPEIERLKGDCIAKYLESNLVFLHPDEIDIQLDKEGGLDWLKARLKERQPDIVIFDPLSEFVSSSTSLSDDTIARKAAKSLNQIAREFDCIPFITTHFKKPEKDVPESVFDKIHGSKFWTNPAVAQIAMYRANQQKYETAKYLEFKFKTVESPSKMLVMRDRDSLWYSETTPDEFSKAKLQPKHVVEILIRKCNGKAVPSIFEEVAAEELGCSRRQIRDLVKLAKEEGLMQKKDSLYVPIVIEKRGENASKADDLPGQTIFDKKLTSKGKVKSKKRRKKTINKGLQKRQSPGSKGEVKGKYKGSKGK